MKIAFDSQVFTNQSYGGISRYYTILAKELVKQHQDAHIFAGVHKNHYLDSLPRSLVSGYNLNSYPPKTSRFFNWLNHSMNQTSFSKWKPDIIHETYYSTKPTLKSNSIRVTTVYDMIHELYADQFSIRDKTTEWKKETFKRVDHIISISESTKYDLTKLFGVEESRISVVHLGVDLTVFQHTNQNHLLMKKPFILYVGSRGGYKNFIGFIKAFSTSKKLLNEFNIISFGGGPFNKNEQTLINQLGFRTNQVLQIGGNDEVLSSLYHQATAFVFPSLYEGFGLPPLEAMAAGCPVVSSNSSSMPEVVRDAGIYFDPNNLNEMRDAIERTVFSTETKQRLIASGYENIKSFSWQKCASETLSVYRGLIGKA